MVTVALSSWGRLRIAEHEVVPLRRRIEAARTLRSSKLPGIAFGNGRCYGDECLNAGHTVWTTRGLDRFIAFDPERGIVHCESGVLLSEITRLALPAGWFLPVTPGTAFVTIGGAVANDVHGKNHHRCGTLGEHVAFVRLARTDGSVIDCTPQVNSDWLAATIGGMGLTGIITEVAIRLRRVSGPWIDTLTQPFDTLDEFFELTPRHASDWEHTVAWIDCTRSTRKDTRGVFFCGNHSDATKPLPPSRARSAALLPSWRWVNGTSTALLNSLYFASCKQRRGLGRQDYGSFFYPLDRVLEWNRIYGRAGFFQYQCVIPAATQADGTRELLRLIAESRMGSFLSVLKTFTLRPSAGLMSFPMAGTTVALDFPNAGPGTLRLFDRLNAVVSDTGGRLYPAKDAVMPAELFRKGFPRLNEFLAYRDPGISSEMSRRLLDI